MSTGLRRVTDVMAYALGHLADVKNYGQSWGDKFVAEQAVQRYDKAIKHLEGFDFKTLTLDELKMIGFRMWTEDLILCPLWAKPLLCPNITDNDTRFGCLAYGWIVSDGKVHWDTSSCITDVSDATS